MEAKSDVDTLLAESASDALKRQVAANPERSAMAEEVVAPKKFVFKKKAKEVKEKERLLSEVESLFDKAKKLAEEGKKKEEEEIQTGPLYDLSLELYDKYMSEEEQLKFYSRHEAFEAEIKAIYDKQKKAAAPVINLHNTQYNLPYVYKTDNLESYLKTGKSLLLLAKFRSEKAPPEPRTLQQIKDTVGFVKYPLDNFQNFKGILYEGGSIFETKRSDSWAGDLMLDWDWQKRGALFYPHTVVGGRIGFRWIRQGEKSEMKKNEAFENIVRLAFEVEPDGKIVWESHARTDYERADDEEVDDFVEKALDKLNKEEGVKYAKKLPLKEGEWEVKEEPKNS